MGHLMKQNTGDRHEAIQEFGAVRRNTNRTVGIWPQQLNKLTRGGVSGCRKGTERVRTDGDDLMGPDGYSH